MNEHQVSSTEEAQIALAQRIDDLNESPDQEGEKYLTFNVNGEVYGSEIDRIKEIIEYGIVTRVPLTPKYLRGVINLRGNVVPVVDLATRLGKEFNQVTKRTCIIIVEMKSTEDKVTAAPQFGADIRADFISGMGKLHKKLVILLQMEEVLSITELSELVELENKEC